MTPDIATIAAGLSEAQRRLMLGETRYTRRATYDKLIALDLMFQVGGFICRTDLGKQVRAYLQEQAK